MQVRKLGIILNGVTGRMGTNQHLMRSLVPIIKEGGIQLSPTEVLLPELMLVGRSEAKLRALVEMSGVGAVWSTDLATALADPRFPVYFDTQTTGRRAPAVRDAVAAGKHIYVEKPSAENSATARELANICEQAGVKNGVVQDKLFLPGVIKLRRAIEKGFFGRILSVRGEFGYCVFEGDSVPSNRPSWNYRKEGGGGIIIDMLAHWRYVLGARPCKPCTPVNPGPCKPFFTPRPPCSLGVPMALLACGVIYLRDALSLTSLCAARQHIRQSPVSLVPGGYAHPATSG